MCKIAQISDIHWRGISRHEEYTDSFTRLFKILREDIKPDLIINTGDTFHTKTNGITPEIIQKLSWMFKEISLIAPSITILGNHDGNLTNLERQDVITPIFEALSLPNALLCKKTESFTLNKIIPNVKDSNKFLVHVYSPFDETNWDNLKTDNSYINLGLFHGCISGSETDLEHVLAHGEKELSYFKNMDFLLLGDIHKNQYLSKRMTEKEELKPWVAYPGSLIQQNFGENERKGFLVWELKDRNNWDVNFVELENKAPFITIPWLGNVFDTIKAVEIQRGEKAFLPGTRYRISSSQAISQVETRQLIADLKERRGAEEVTFKFDFVSKMDTIDIAKGTSLSKTDLKSNFQGLFDLYKQYIEAHTDSIVLTQEQIDFAEKTIKDYLNKLNFQEPELTQRNVSWAIKNMKFDNIFRYGENNSIDFSKLDGIVGVFGPNKSGKSSLVGSLMYGLYNTTDRGPLKGAYIINKNKKQCSVDISFTVAGDEYLLQRQTVRSSSKKKDDDKTTSSLNLYRKNLDGSLVEMNSISRDDTDKEIRKLIGTSDDFLMTAFSSQGDSNKFINEGATKRKNILTKFLNLDIFEKLYVYAKDDYQIINEKTKSYQSVNWVEVMNTTKQEIDLLEYNVVNEEKKIKEFKSELEENIFWLRNHQQQTKQINFLENKKNFDSLKLEKEKLLFSKSDCLLNINLISDKIKDIENKIQTIDIQTYQEKQNKFEEIKISLMQAKSSYEKEKIILENQEKSVKKLEIVPCGDSFPSCHFIKDSHEDKKNLQEQMIKVNQIFDLTNSIKEQFEQFIALKISDKIKEYDSLQKEHTTLQKEKDNIDLRKNLIVEKLNFINEKYDLAEKKYLESIDKDSFLIEKEIEDKKQKINSLEEQIKSSESIIKTSLFKLGSKTDILNKNTTDYEEGKKYIEQLKLFDSILNAFNKNGIPAMVLKSQLPAINSEIDKVLNGFIDFKIYLETDVNSNIMDVFIEDNHSKRVIELASGMEKMICSLALRIALINISSLPRPNIFIVDEGWGTLDKEHIQKISGLMSALKENFKTVLLITHIQEIKEMVDMLIDIKNDNIESHIEA